MKQEIKLESEITRTDSGFEWTIRLNGKVIRQGRAKNGTIARVRLRRALSSVGTSLPKGKSANPSHEGTADAATDC